MGRPTIIEPNQDRSLARAARGAHHDLIAGRFPSTTWPLPPLPHAHPLATFPSLDDRKTLLGRGALTSPAPVLYPPSLSEGGSAVGMLRRMAARGGGTKEGEREEKARGRGRRRQAGEGGEGKGERGGEGKGGGEQKGKENRKGRTW